MAKKSVIYRNFKREKKAALQAEKREQLRKQRCDESLSFEERLEAQFKLQALPRNGAPTRIRHRCRVTGRGRGCYRKFGLSRIKFREMALDGMIPGVVKSSW